MITDLLLPELGENITTGVIVTILVNIGDAVESGQPVVEIETDKAVVEVPAETSGVVSAIHVSKGDEIRVGQKILSVDTRGEATGPEAAEPETETAQEPAGPETTHPIEDAGKPAQDEDQPVDFGRPSTPSPGNVAPAAPSVRRFAREIGIDINRVSGTGPGGRISLDDVKTHARQVHDGQVDTPQGAPPGVHMSPLPDFSKWGKVVREPMSPVRRKTAHHLAKAWTTVAHVTHFDEADVTHMEDFRKAYANRVAAAGGKLTVTAIMLKIVANALAAFPAFNAAVDMAQNEIVYKKYTNIGVAVDTDRGLLVPVVRQVDQKSLTGLAVELTRLAEMARTRKLSLEDMQGGNFTISNLGGIGGTGFTPIVNSPEVAILGLSRAKMAMVHRDGQFEPRQMLPLSLSYDHRIIDGADAARFLRWIVEAVVHPMAIAL